MDRAYKALKLAIIKEDVPEYERAVEDFLDIICDIYTLMEKGGLLT